MGLAKEKRDIRELVGIAVNTSGLTMKVNQERALDRIAALGAASLAMRLGVDREDLPIAAAKPLVYGDELDIRDVLAGELAPVLWHVRFGGQYDQVPAAITLFAGWVSHHRLFAEWKAPEHLRLRLAYAERVMHEWLSDKCTACGGSGKQQRSQGGQWIRPQGLMQRNAIFRTCSACQGTRRPPPSPPQRMKALGLTREEYDSQRWDQRFSAGFHWLNRFLPPRLERALTAELGRRKRRV